jgi:osmotically-inducible protein OsmY
VKSSAENAVKSVEGVSNVINNIKVLPVSSEDEGVRRDEVR